MKTGKTVKQVFFDLGIALLFGFVFYLLGCLTCAWFASADYYRALLIAVIFLALAAYNAVTGLLEAWEALT